MPYYSYDLIGYGLVLIGVVITLIAQSFVNSRYKKYQKVNNKKGLSVRLSTDIFHGESIAAASVAAHEVGHAIQDKEGYFFIRLRGFIFPLVSFASKFGYLAIMIGFLFNMLDLAWGGIGLLLVRALVHLEKMKILDKKEHSGSEEMLKAAAMTYVAGLATTLLEIFRYVLILIGRDRND